MELLKQLAPIFMVAGMALLAMAVAAMAGVVTGWTAKPLLIAGAICMGVAALLSDIEQAGKDREQRQASQAPQTGQPGNYQNSNTGGPIAQNPDSGQRNANSTQELPPGTYVIGGQTIIVLSSSATGTGRGMNVESGASTAAVAR